MHSPVLAMLWENWRLTRVEAAQRLALGIVAGSAAVVLLGDAGATVAFWILLSQYVMFWMSIAKLTGGRFMDGYRPGFPLPLLYTRPVPTATIVGVTMAYDALSCAALYLISAALLGFAFGQPFPLLSMATWLVAFHVLSTSVQWSTRSRVVQWVGSFGIWISAVGQHMNLGGLPTLPIEISATENAVMASIGLVSFGLTVAGVARQRRGDTARATPRTATAAGFQDWLASLFPLPCPTSSPMRAQAWFNLRTSGVPVLALGAVLAMMNPLLFALSIPIAWLRPFATGIAMFSGPVILVLGGGNAFGMRRKHGRTYTSPFEATLPYGTAGLAAHKVLVRSVCILTALVAVGVSVWESSSLIGAWEPWMMDGKETARNLLRTRNEFGSAIGSFTGYQLAATVLVASIGIVLMVASRAAVTALRARYPRQLLIVSSVLMLYPLAIVGSGIFGFNALLVGYFRATAWILATAIAFATVYLCWVCISERLLTLGHMGVAILASAAFGAAVLTLLRAAGLQLADMSTAATLRLLLAALLPLMAAVLAPWSLSRVRHT